MMMMTSSFAIAAFSHEYSVTYEDEDEPEDRTRQPRPNSTLTRCRIAIPLRASSDWVSKGREGKEAVPYPGSHGLSICLSI